jgi:hypothetical protein
MVNMKKVNMNVNGNSEQTLEANVIPLFAKIELQDEIMSDPLQDLIAEGMMDWTHHLNEQLTKPRAERLLVSANNFPDQSIFVLEQQMTNLKERMERLRFFLNDLDDLLPR